MPDVFDMLTERQRAVWGAGDWLTMAPLIAPASKVVIDRLDVRPGHDYLDVGTGDGVAAINAAGRGARVTGLDLIPEWVEGARRNAREAGVEATFVQGDAQDLPFDDDSFDRVSSAFGAMFAPDHRRAASELVRVCRPGGRIVVAAWTPEGLNGRMFMTLGKHLPPPPEGFTPPVLWGTEDHVRQLFSGHEVEFERAMLRTEGESFDEYFGIFERSLGPIVTARALLEPEGKWEAARDEVISVYQSGNQRNDGGLRTDAEYLLTTITKL